MPVSLLSFQNRLNNVQITFYDLTLRTRVKQHECFTTALINHIVSIESDTSSIALGLLYPQQFQRRGQRSVAEQLVEIQWFAVPHKSQTDRERNKKLTDSSSWIIWTRLSNTGARFLCQEEERQDDRTEWTFFRNYLVQAKSIGI